MRRERKHFAPGGARWTNGCRSSALSFVAAQLRALDQESFLYLFLNLAGSAILAVLAFLERQWGFLLLEGVWALVSLLSIIRQALRS